jgi:predicted nucleic acid-binding protein
VDSDILIEVFRARDRELVKRWHDLEASGAVIEYSPVSAAELWAGARTNEFEATVRLFDALRCVPIDRETGTRAGHFLRRYAKSHSLELADAVIAATATIAGAALWTRNRKHFPMPELSFF